MRARILWFSTEMGGRDTGRPPGPQYRPNALFFELSNDSPNASTLYARVLLDFVEEEDGETIAEARAIAPKVVASHWHDGATMLLMEGQRPIGYARLFEH